MPTRTRKPQCCLVRSPSTPILQLRDGDDGAGHCVRHDNELCVSPYICGSSSWSSAVEDGRGPNDTSSDGNEGAVGSDEADRPCGHSHSPHVRHHDEHQCQQSNILQHSSRGAPQRAMIASVRRGGMSGHKSSGNESRSASSRNDQEQSTSSFSSHTSKSKCVSPAASSGYAAYHRPPPATAMVISPSQSSSTLVGIAPTSPPSMRADGTPSSADKPNSRVSLTGGEYHSHQGDAGTAPSTPPGAATATAIAVTNPSESTDSSYKATIAFSTPDASLVAASASASSSDQQDTPPDSSPETLHHVTSSIAQSASTYGCSRLNTTASVSSSSPQYKVSDTPLTYETVASVSSVSSLHRRRLPQSRVGFGNFRKRVCGSGAGSTGSTACSATNTPVTAVGSPSLFTESLLQNSCTAKDYCDSSCAFLSLPLTPLSHTSPSCATVLSANGSMHRATEKDSPMSSQSAEESERAGEGVQLDSTAKWDASQAQGHAPHPQVMPPIPPSLHRHQPTDFFLPLQRQHPQSPDSDKEEAATWVWLRKQVNGLEGCSNGDSNTHAGPLQRPPSAAGPAQQPGTSSSSGDAQETVAGRASPLSASAARAAAAQLLQSAMSRELSRCRTSSTARHTGPALAAKAAAGLHLAPILTRTPAASPVTSSILSTPSAPTTQKQPHPTTQVSSRCSADASHRYGSNNDASSPAIPAPSAVKGAHHVSSAMSFFSAAEIIPGLFLGSYGDAMDVEALAARGISLVINCSLECAVTPAMANNPHHIRYLQCPLRDHSDEAIAPFFTPVTQIIHEQLHRRQINQQRIKTKKAAATARALGSGARRNEDVEGCAQRGKGCRSATCVCASQTATLHTGATTTALTEGGAGSGSDVNDTAGALRDRMMWAWADEAENIWAAPPSPASPLLSVGGQPSLKEGKRETPRTPPPAVGQCGRSNDSNTSRSISSSSSPIPGLTSTFPGMLVSNTASTPTSSAEPLTSTVKGTATTTTAPDVPDSTSGNNSSDSAVQDYGVGTSHTIAAAVAANFSTPLTVIDPRDCGGVLVHCRMGVSRSATFVMAYLILYGCTLANLEDTASLFVRFMERERKLIEEAGGRAFLGLDANCSGDRGVTGNTSVPVSATRSIRTLADTSPNRRGDTSTFGSPLLQSGALFRNNSLAQSNSRFNAAVSNPMWSGSDATVSASSPLGMRRPANSCSPWYTQRSSNNSNPTGPQLSSFPSYTTSTYASQAPTSHRRPAASLCTPALFPGGASVASPRSTPSSSQLRPYTPLTPLEVCSRVCRPCQLQRLRERRLQQQAKITLLMSGEQQQQQQQLGSADGSRFTESVLGAEVGDRLESDDPLLLSSSSNNIARSSDSRADKTVTSQHPVEPQQPCSVPHLTPSSAPVLSYRSDRGSYGVGRTLLEAALEDDVAKGLKRGEGEEGGAEGPVVAAKHSGSPCVAASELPLHADRDGLLSGCAVHAAGGAPLQNSLSVCQASTAAHTEQEKSGRIPVGGAPSVHQRLASTGHHPTGTPNHSDLPNGSYSVASSHSMLSADLAPAMTFREAFDMVKKQKMDVNPNIGFVLALRELAGGCDFSISTSF
ncbi:Phophatase-like protein [Leptomonas seymouri]|uniref:protein-tyrosine-phosphatase n=1 Tax=Leptomonas seymouri TaxID=5684 RepID=A0A0N1PF26_LEPSE|nr:Phophatase-like protein [Leptomonas seymouri]|eukprot:KPI88041.1 Phophatase-like protein [Leptomonas seymouri]